MNGLPSLVCVGIRTAILAVSMLAMFAGCAPEGGCKSTITGDSNTVTQACGGSGENSGGSVVTPAPVVVPPVVITPVITEGGEVVEPAE